MSGNHSGDRSSGTGTFRSADEIVRSILDDHASTSSQLSPSGELFRAIERFHANAHRRSGLVQSARRDLVRSHLHRWASASASASQSSSESTPPSPSADSMSYRANPNSEPYRRFSREPQPATGSNSQGLPPLRSLISVRRSAAPPSSGPSSASSGRHGRWRATVERHADRHRTPITGSNTRGANSHLDEDYWRTLGYEPEFLSSFRYGQSERDHQQLHDADDANHHPRGLPDFSNPSPQPYSELSFPSPPLQSQELPDESRRIKRRRLDTDRLPSGFRGFRYGKYGQVEQGPLTMEIVSCDGGMYSEDGQSYAAENILKNDVSVYCTKGPRCNIILKHQGSTVFTLKELVIKAPLSNFTSPVQDGMVFISMCQEELARTAGYKIQYLPSRNRAHHTSRETRPLAPIVSIRHNEDGTTMTQAQLRARRLYNIGREDQDNDYRRVAQIPLEFAISAPQFNVTTVCSDEELDDSMGRSNGRAPNRIGSLPFESENSDEDEMGEISLYPTDYRRRRRRRYTPLWEAADDTEASPEEPQEPPQSGGGGLMTPHAIFSIKNDKSKCTIKFDPPVSGRFILLKMWSPKQDPNSNIDIQAVVANGFAGPRYFPDVEMR